MYFSSNINIILLSQFLVGAGTFGMISLISIYFYEISSNVTYTFSLPLLYVSYSLGEVLIYPFTKFTLNWRDFNLVFLCLPTLALLVYFFLTLVESP